MKFEIMRASDYMVSPCTEAVKENNNWFIEIKTLEDLISFKEKYGSLILQDRVSEKGNLIYIYDDYME